MSADNHVAVLNSKDGFRVAHIQALDNLVWWHVDGAEAYQSEQRDTINPFVLYQYFKKAPFFATREEAFNHAQFVYNKIGHVEYGICEVFYENEFPNKQPPCCEKPDVMNLDFDLQANQCLNCGEYQ